MGIFKNYQLSQVGLVGSGRYFKEGEYVVRIENTKMVREGYKGDSIIIEAEVLYAESNEEDAPPVNSIASQVLNLSGDKTKTTMSLKNWMGFLCAIAGVEDTKAFSDEEWDEMATEAIENNALKDSILKLSCYTTTTKENKPFTAHRWAPQPSDEYLKKVGLI